MQGIGHFLREKGRFSEGKKRHPLPVLMLRSVNETLDERHNERLRLSWASLYERATGLQARLRAQDTTFATQNVRAIWEEVLSATKNIGDNADNDDDEVAQ